MIGALVYFCKFWSTWVLNMVCMYHGQGQGVLDQNWVRTGRMGCHGSGSQLGTATLDHRKPVVSCLLKLYCCHDAAGTAELCSGLLYILALLFGSGQFGACYGETWLTRCPGFRWPVLWAENLIKLIFLNWFSQSKQRPFLCSEDGI